MSDKPDDTKVSIEYCIERWRQITNTQSADELSCRLLSELARLRAVDRDNDLKANRIEQLEALVAELKSNLADTEPQAEAWRAVRDKELSGCEGDLVFHEIHTQIARLDQMKGEVKA